MTIGLRTTASRFLPCFLLLCICSIALPAELDELLANAKKAVDEQRMDDALTLATEAIAADSKSAMAYFARGYVYMTKGSYDKAIADFAEALQLDPKMWKAYSNRGVCYARLNDFDKAIADYTETIRLQPNDFAIFLFRGSCFLAVGNYPKAYQDLSEATRINPNSAEVYESLARVKYAMRRDFSEVLQDTTRSLELEPHNTRVRVFRARCHEEKGDYDEAIRDCDEAIRLDRYLAEAHFVKAASLANQGQFAKAFDAVNTAIGIDPAMATAYLLRAALYDHEGDRAKAQSDVERASELKPNDPDCLEAHGVYRIRLGDYEGIDDIKTAYRFRSVDLDAILERTESHELDRASLEFGEQQVRAMLKDRPAMAQYGDKAEVLYRWAALEFAGKSSGERFQWDPALPDAPIISQMVPLEDTGGVVQVRGTSAEGKDAGRELGFEESWRHLVFGLHYTAAVRDFRRRTIKATEGKLTKNEFVEQKCRRDSENIERDRAFYVHTFLPWAKEHRVPTNPSLWILDREAVGKQLLAIQPYYEQEYDLFALSGMFQRGEIEKAIDFAEGYLARAGTETTRRLIPLIQGYCLLKSHQPEAAVAAFDKVGDAYPQCMDAYLGRAAAYGVLGDAKKTADNIAAARAIRATHANMPLHSPPIDKGLDGNRELAKKLDLDERLYPLRDEILHEIGRIQLWSGYAVSTDSFSRPAE